MCYIVLIRIRHDRLTATTYPTSWRERWRQRFTYKTMTFYHTPEEVNNLYSDNPPAGPPPYTGPTPGQEDVVEMEDQAHSQSLDQETQECGYTTEFAERLEKTIH